MVKWQVNRLDESCLFPLPVEEQRLWVATRLKVAQHLLEEAETDPTTNIDKAKVLQQVQLAEQDFADWGQRKRPLLDAS